MNVDLKKTWAEHRKIIGGIFSTLIFLALIIWLSVWAINVPNWPSFTGFNGKTIWDLLDLLVVPVMLAIGGFLFSWLQHKTAGKVELDRQREAALRAYLNQMAELLLEKNLRDSSETEVRSIARAWTITLLRDLDGVRKGILLRFLHETALMRKPAIVIMEEADLSGAELGGAYLWNDNLSKANLCQANLSRAKLSGTDFSNADLSEADLRNAWLPSAILRQAILIKANLSGIDLSGIDLSNADLRKANLSKANLSWANLEGANLERADLTGTKYNYATTWPEGFDPTKKNLILVKDPLGSLEFRRVL